MWGITFFRYGIEQVQPKVIFTSYHLIPKLMKILATFPHNIDHIIYFEHHLKKKPNFEKLASAGSTGGKQQTYGNIGIGNGCSDTKLSSVSTIAFSKLELSGRVAKENKRAPTAGRCK